MGVNDYVEENEVLDVEILKIDPQTERDQVGRLQKFKENRDQEAVAARLDDLREVAQGTATCCRRSRRPCACTPPSARSAA